MKQCEICKKEIPEDFQNLLCLECYQLAAEENERQKALQEEERQKTMEISSEKESPAEATSEPKSPISEVKNGISDPNYQENPEMEDKEQWQANFSIFMRNGVMLWKPTRQMYSFIKDYCLEKIKLHPQYPKFLWRPKIVDVGCFVAGTSILTGNYDEIPIEKIKKGNVIISSQNNRRKVVNTFVRDVNEIYELGFEYGIKIKTTGEHPFLSVKRKQLECSAKKGVFCRFVDNICKRCGKSVSVFPEYREVKDLYKNDYVVIPHLNKVKKSFDKENLISQLLGYYLAEGWILYSRKPRIKKNIVGIGFCFNSNEIDYVNDVKRLGEKLGTTSVNIKTRKHRHTSEVFIYSSVIGKLLFKLGGRLSHKKKIDRKVFYFSNENKINVIRNWLKGDGHHTSFIKVYNTRQSETVNGKSVSINLLKGLRRLCLQVGICPGLGKEQLIFSGEDIDLVWGRKDKIKRNSQRYLKFQGFVLIPIRNIKKTNELTKVFNLEVESDNSYIANNLAVHNCGIGCGSNILSQEADLVWGIDKNHKTIEFAKQCFERVKNNIYYSSQVSFDEIDIMEDTREFLKFDICVAVEIVEHIVDHRKFLKTLIEKFDKRKDGYEATEYFISTPNRNNKHIHKDKPQNKAHVKEFTSEEFYDVLSEFFNKIEFFAADGKPTERTTEHTPILAKTSSPKI